MYAPGFHVPAETYAFLDPARKAIAGCEKVSIAYRDVKGEASQRTIRPLGLYLWGSPGARVGWCESREAFRP